MIKPDRSEVTFVLDRSSPNKETEKRNNIENWLTDVTEHSKEWSFTEETVPPQRDKKVHIAINEEWRDRDRTESPQFASLKRELTTYRGKIV